MAVIQISRIQLRRGKKNSVSGVPQLSSAEMAWAVDSQELYIGNGSVTEGAPYVGNTRILTEHENLLELISSYQYAADDASMAQWTAPRSIQHKLDETVSVADFGLVPDLIKNADDDNALIFNNAVRRLYIQNTQENDNQFFTSEINTRYKKVLMIPNGTYTFESDLIIPSNVILRGETPFGVIFDIGEHNIRFIAGREEYPKNVIISNVTIQRTTGQVILTELKHSEFDVVTVSGEYEPGPINISNEKSALFWRNTNQGTATTDIRFKRCTFANNSVSINATNLISTDTHIKFDDCVFVNNHDGNFVDGILNQGVYWTYRNCTFENIYRSAFISVVGKGTVIRNSTFTKVGNNGLAPRYPEHPMVNFGQRFGNVVLECFSDRMQAAHVQNPDRIHAIPEVVNADKVTFLDRIFTEIAPGDQRLRLAVFSSDVKTYNIDYVLRLENLYRKGELTIAVGGAENPSNNEVSLSDNFIVSPNLATSTEGLVISGFEFIVRKAEGSDNTIELLYKQFDNNDPDDPDSISGLPGSVSFDVKYSN